MNYDLYRSQTYAWRRGRREGAWRFYRRAPSSRKLSAFSSLSECSRKIAQQFGIVFQLNLVFKRVQEQLRASTSLPPHRLTRRSCWSWRDARVKD
jgi:hypothetical protein